MRRNEDASSESVAAEHLDLMFAELDAAARVVRDKCDPVRLAAKYPLATVALSLGLGFYAARRLSKEMAPQAAPAGEPQARRGGGIPWEALLQVALTVAPLLIPKPPQQAEPPPSAQPVEGGERV